MIAFYLSVSWPTWNAYFCGLGLLSDEKPTALLSDEKPTEIICDLIHMHAVTNHVGMREYKCLRRETS